MVKLLESALASPLLWGTFAVVALAIALSGKVSMSATAILLWIACAMGIFGISRIEVLRHFDPLLRLLILGCIVFGLAVVTVVLQRWLTTPKAAVGPQSSATIQESTSPTPKESPHVQALLIIDSVTSQAVCYHFHLENIGKILVRDIHFSFSNERVADVENMVPVERTLPVGGKMEVSGPPLAFLPYKYSRVVATISYSVEGSTDRFASTYNFVANPNKEKTIAPEGWTEQSGITEGPSMAGVLARTGASQGTLFMVIPELRPDGKPNVVIFRDARKYLRFDPVSHTVDYNLLLNSGRPLTFQLPFKDYKLHIIDFTWDYKKGGRLAVDGVAQDKVKQKGQP